MKCPPQRERDAAGFEVGKRSASAAAMIVMRSRTNRPGGLSAFCMGTSDEKAICTVVVSFDA
jgi:hypothetical protein